MSSLITEQAQILEPQSSEDPIFGKFAERYPRTVAAFETMPDGARALSAVADLEKRWIGLQTGQHDWSRPLNSIPHSRDLPTCAPENQYDVIIAGGGLGLIAGAALAARGLRVMVFDRDRVGAAHREWNISQRELTSLTKWGIFSTAALDGTIATRYGRGLISFDATGTGVPACPLELSGVLDVALDAQSVLDLARERFIMAGGTILEGRSFAALHTATSGPIASVFELRGQAGRELYRCRLAVDMMGSVSPIATALNNGLPFDGVCPTAGTVMEGLEGDSSVGDVLVSVAPAQGGRQLIWEGFPGKSGETTVYLFYYDRTGATEAPKQGLLDLFERYFTLLSTYRNLNEDFRHLKPVFGYIPARHGRAGRTAARGLICMGDSAAGQSPLTFCGFGSFVRHIGRTAMLLDYAVKRNLLEERHLGAISPHQANLRVGWVFSRFMQTWPGDEGTGVNRIMNVFCRALGEAGDLLTRRFLQDRYTFADYLRIMLTTARREPGVVPLSVRVLGPRGVLKWGADMAAFAANDALHAISNGPARQAWKMAERGARKFAPGVALKLMALRSGWEAVRG